MNSEVSIEDARASEIAEVCELYYNEGLTQQEIARRIGSNRFRVAKLLQYAREEGIVEIKIHQPNKRSYSLEGELKAALPLDTAIVLDTKELSDAEAAGELGKYGADYLKSLLKKGSTIGVTWGKSIRSIVSELDTVSNSPLNSVQLCGCFRHTNRSVSSRELAHQIALRYNGQSYDMNVPIYINDDYARKVICREPQIMETLSVSKKMNIVLTGIGSVSSLPMTNPVLKSYLSDADIRHMDRFIGSIYGRVLDSAGQIAGTDLNKKLIAASMQDILTTPHRIAIARGRHKIRAIQACIQNRYINELITDRITAEQLIAG